MTRFDENYRESVALRDGSRVTLRLIRPRDKALLREGFERLSAESRYRRFLSAKTDLSDADLVYLTEVDGHDHFAMGVVREDAKGLEEGLAIARFIRSKTDPRAAEMAVAVVDDWQRRGLGTLLLSRLVAAAQERGIERIEGRALAANAAIHEMLAHSPGGLGLRPEGDELSFTLDIRHVPAGAVAGPPEHRAPHGRLFSLIARGLVFIRQAL